MVTEGINEALKVMAIQLNMGTDFFDQLTLGGSADDLFNDLPVFE
jgi:hypothetical protein